MNMKDLSLHGIIGGGGSNIKSVQRGSFIWNFGGLTNDISIANVNTSNSIVIVTQNLIGTVSPNMYVAAAEVLNSNTLRFTRNTSATGETHYSWEVIEFNNVKSLQTGKFTQTQNFTDESITISKINLSKSILVASASSAHTSTASILQLSKLVNDTTITFRSLGNVTSYWQVIEFN